MPATGSLGTLTGKLSMESAAFIRDMGKAAASVESNTAKINKSFASIATVAKGAFAVFAATEAIKAVKLLIDLGKQAINTGDEIGAAATKLGIGAEALQRFRFAAAQTDVDTASLDAALKVFQKNLASGQISSSAHDMTGAFDEWINKIREAPTQLEKVQIATTAFSKQFQSALLIAEQGDTFLESLRSAFTISQEGINVASELDNKMRALQNAAEAGFNTGFLEAFIGKLGDSKTSLKGINEAMKELGGILGSIAANATRLLDATLSRIQEFIKEHPEFAKAPFGGLAVEPRVQLGKGTVIGPGVLPGPTALPPAIATGAGGRSGVGGINMEVQKTTEAFNNSKEAIGAWSTEVTDALGRTLTDMDSINKEGTSMFASLQTPMEQYASNIQRIDFLQSKGAITAETAARAHVQNAALMASSYLGAASQISGALAGIFKDNKAFGIANAVISTAEGIAKAMILPFPLNWTQAVAVAATGAAQIATIMSAQPGSGRIPSVKGGKSKAISSGETAAASSTETMTPTTPAAAGLPPPGQAVNITLMGTGGFDREQVRALIVQINAAVGDGAQIRVSG